MKNKTKATLLVTVAVVVSIVLGLPLFALRSVFDLMLLISVAIARGFEGIVDGIDKLRKVIYRTSIKPIFNKAEELVNE